MFLPPSPSSCPPQMKVPKDKVQTRTQTRLCEAVEACLTSLKKREIQLALNNVQPLEDSRNILNHSCVVGFLRTSCSHESVWSSLKVFQNRPFQVGPLLSTALFQTDQKPVVDFFLYQGLSSTEHCCGAWLVLITPQKSNDSSSSALLGTVSFGFTA